ncbi:DegV family protein [Cardiobacteriaceae bacterium TAE3-ERU3]|nr:DegV family protein [Cardiobacteriaceae bacterium TAE3-ERU3]
MGKYILATDSTSCLHYIAPHVTDVEILPLYLFMRNQPRRDSIDITIDEFLQWMNDHPDELPYSRPPLEYDIDRMICRWIEQGYEEALFVTLSGAISKTNELVKKNALKYKDKIKIAVFDSRSQSVAQAMLLLEGKRLLESGNSLSATVTKLEFMRRRGQLFFTLQTLSYLVRNGRFDKKKATVANLFRVKPILSFNEEGSIIPIEQALGLNQAMQICIDKCEEFVLGRSATIFVSHAGDKKGIEFQRKVERHFPETRILSVLTSPVIACHTGPGLYGIGAFLNE